MGPWGTGVHARCGAKAFLGPRADSPASHSCGHRERGGERRGLLIPGTDDRNDPQAEAAGCGRCEVRWAAGARGTWEWEGAGLGAGLLALRHPQGTRLTFWQPGLWLWDRAGDGGTCSLGPPPGDSVMEVTCPH